jgi:hypothetical protein
MAGPLIAIVGDANPNRAFDPSLDASKAKQAAEELGTELARCGARLLVYGGPFIEADVVRGFVAGKPATDRSILMWYTMNQEPPPFPEEASHPSLFERRAEAGADWEIAFFRSVARADGVILIGGGSSTKITGQLAIGMRMPILSLAVFGGAAAKVWETLSPGVDLPNRDEINLMARSWAADSAAACVRALLAQHRRRHPRHTFAYVTLGWLVLTFLAALTGILLISEEAISDSRLLLAVALAGAGGATLQGFTALLDYIGNRAYQRSWTAYFLLRPLVGAGIALVVYVLVRSTLVHSNAGAAVLNFYGVLTLSLLSGFYSRTALVKLIEIFETLSETKGIREVAKSNFALKPERSSSVRHPLDVYRGYVVLQLSPVDEGSRFNLTVWAQPNPPVGLLAARVDIGEGLPAKVTKFRVAIYADGCDVEPLDAELRVETDKPQSGSLVFGLMCPQGTPTGLVEISQYGRTVSVVSFGGSPRS